MIKPILFNIYNTLCQADMSVLNWGVWLPLSFTFCRDAFSSKLNKLATTKPSQYSLMKVNDMSDMFMGIYADFIWLTLVVWRPYIKHHYVEILFSFFFFFLIDVMTSEMHFRIQVSVLDGRLSEQDGKHCLLQWLTGSLEFWKYYKKNCDKLNVFHLKSSYNEKIDSLTHSLVSLFCRSIWAAAASCSLHAT